MFHIGVGLFTVIVMLLVGIWIGIQIHRFWRWVTGKKRRRRN